MEIGRDKHNCDNMWWDYRIVNDIIKYNDNNCYNLLCIPTLAFYFNKFVKCCWKLYIVHNLSL